LFDSKARHVNVLVIAERPLLEMAHRFWLPVKTIEGKMQDFRGRQRYCVKRAFAPVGSVDSTACDVIGKIDPIISPYENIEDSVLFHLKAETTSALLICNKPNRV